MPPKSRKRKRVEEKTNWFDLPAEMREMVIDQMDPKTRCKFAQCSKLCEKEVKGSRNHLCAINIVDSLFNHLYIGYNKSEYHYCLSCIDCNTPEEPKTMVCYTRMLLESEDPEQGLKWVEIENDTAVNVRNKYANYFIEKYKKSIKKLEISLETNGVSNANINLKCLKNLEIIKMDSTIHRGDFIELGLLSLEQIYAADYLDLRFTKFTFDDLKKFKASVYTVKIDDFNEESFSKYLRMLKNGELLGNRKNFDISTGEHRLIDGRKMTENLNVFDYRAFDTTFSFKFHLNNQKDGKRETASVENVMGRYIINFEYE